MRSFRPIYAMLFVTLLCAIGIGVVWAVDEMRTSLTQSKFFTKEAAKLAYHVESGAAPLVQYPTFGPYNKRLGYIDLPFFIKSMRSNGYQIDHQARASDNFQNYIFQGGIPVFNTKASAGLTIYDRSGEILHAGNYPSRIFLKFNDIPKLMVDTLLFIENRELLQKDEPTKNPVIEWKRMGTAAVGLLAGRLSDEAGGAGGASTLATQLEKFRFSPDGVTGGIKEKLRQIIAASLRVYQNGPDTTAARKQIVVDYLNATPLAARQNWGEIIGIGDGLWAWFGLELNDITHVLDNQEESKESLRDKAQIYRSVVALIVSQRRPGYYLVNNRAALEELVDATLDRLAAANLISNSLYEASRKTRLVFLAESPPLPTASFVTQKAANSARAHLLSFFGINNLFELDRYDMRVSTTLDLDTQMRITDFLMHMKDPVFVQENGMIGERLLSLENDLSKIIWTISLYEKGEHGNAVRVQADNYDQPLDLNESAKLDLGSTAKLRTLITYLQIIDELYTKYHGYDSQLLQAIAARAPDNLTQWTASWLIKNRDGTAKAMLEAAMQRSFSANANEVFFTGGGVHRFVNFEKEDNGKVVTIAEAFRKSINLPFIRLMREVVNYTIAQGPNKKQEILGDPSHPARRAYLERFADSEGSQFLNRFYNIYQKLDAEAALEKLISRSRKTTAAIAVIFRSVFPQEEFPVFAAYMRRAQNLKSFTDRELKDLYKNYAVDAYSLSDRGYVAGVHPLELWLVSWRWQNPAATRRDMLEASLNERITSYNWLYNARKGAQDNRIRILLEQDAFTTIQQRWAKLGYPFEKLVPSLATAIGSSADRPGALAELMGIILNDGVRRPSLRVTNVTFASGTPYETSMSIKPGEGERVLSKDITDTVKTHLLDVVANGTAKRVHGAFRDTNGSPLDIGGKTGTGDHRFEVFGKDGTLISSRVVNRTATFIFYIGDRFFGAVTAHVKGKEAGQYHFTSALPSQMLKVMAPILQPLIMPMDDANRSIASAAKSGIPNLPDLPKKPVVIKSTSAKKILPPAASEEIDEGAPDISYQDSSEQDVDENGLPTKLDQADIPDDSPEEESFYYRENNPQ